MDFLDKQIAPPKSWEKFEDLMRALFAEVWAAPLTQKNGRTGQAQHGVDVYGSPSKSAGEFFGVQCKGKNQGYNAKATTSEFDAELAKAEAFEPALENWVFATTAPNDAQLQRHVRKISKVRASDGKFEVEVLGWESIVALIAQHPKIIRHFYPEHIAGLDATAALAEVSLEALLSIDDKLQHEENSLSLVRPAVWKKAKGALISNQIVRLTGDGGSGKSGILKRLALSHDGPIILLKDNRITATGLQEHFAQLGISVTPRTLFDELSSYGTVLCLIDGADRLLMSPRRGVVTDFLSAISKHVVSGHWKLITSAREFQDRDLVSAALIECGIGEIGEAVTVSSITNDDCQTIAAAFKRFAPLLNRTDLAGQNRQLFLLRELLKQRQVPTKAPTEIDLATLWASSDQGDPIITARRNKALSQMGSWLVNHPTRMPNLGEFDPEGLRQLIDEGCMITDPYSDSVSLAFDVHEDWLVARSFVQRCEELPDFLLDAEEPLWWLRAIRLAGQSLLERGQFERWVQVLSVIQNDQRIDPAWSRNWLVAALYSENSESILPGLQQHFEEDAYRLLKRLLETLLVFETRIDHDILAAPALAHLSETERYSIASYLKQPNWRSWGSFLRWSLPRWQKWPANLIPQLAEIGRIFCRGAQSFSNDHSRQIAVIAQHWLIEIEDAQYTTNWDEHRTPFETQLPDREGWKLAEDRLRDALQFASLSAASEVESYLDRLNHHPRLGRPRGKLLSSPGMLPSKFPRAWTQMCKTHFLPPRPRSRLSESQFLGRELFSWHEFHDAGIHDSRSCYPPSPLRAGFADLFASDEVEALHLFHRLEMRASVFWRWYRKCQDHQLPRPIRLRLNSSVMTLWGDETVYRWSRAVLGSHVLGSAYLALDDWMHKKALDGYPIDDLIELVIQQNGLVSTAAICISLLKKNVNSLSTVHSAGAFVGEPKFWNYDIRRHIDDQSPVHRIGYSFSERGEHFNAVEAIYARNSILQPLSHSLVLPFRLMANAETQAAFDAQRETWSAKSLADYESQLDDEKQMAEFADRIDRIFSDTDPKQIDIQHNEAESHFEVRIRPPQDRISEIQASEENQRRLNDVSRLAVWAEKTKENGLVADGMTLEEAMKFADDIQNFHPVDDPNDAMAFATNLRNCAIVGVAAVAAIHATPDFVSSHEGWIRDRLLSGARIRRGAQEQALTVDQAILTFDPQVFAAWGLAAFACRFGPEPQIDECVIALVIQRLHAVMEATLDGLDWAARPDFARKVVITAFDNCVIDVGHFWKPKEREKAARRMDKRRIKLARSALKFDEEDRVPYLPPAPYTWQWVATGKWYAPFKRLKLRSKIVLDWSRAESVIKKVEWNKLCDTHQRRALFSSYLGKLVDWTRAYSETDDARRADNHFPYEWGHRLASEIGRFAASHGNNKLWEKLQNFEYRDRSYDLVGDYLDSISQELMISGRKPDERFWSAWLPAAQWVVATAIPTRRDHYDHLHNVISAAGFVGPYSTPIPPDWPYVADVLEWVDQWQEKTAHLPSAASDLLRIVDRLTVEQRAIWYLSWLERLVQLHGSDESVWQYNSLGDRAAALLKPLAGNNESNHATARRCLAVIADAGCNVAREIMPMFAQQRKTTT